MRDPFTVTLYGPEDLLVMQRELTGTRSISVALDISRKVLLHYKEQGHKAAMVKLQGRGVHYSLH